MKVNFLGDEFLELISVIIPVYNVEKYLRRCVESVQRQTYKNLEIILVDDGSPDSSPQICDQLASEDSRIKVIHKENAGQGLARNSGLEVAEGSYVTFVDSDDWISESHIANLYSAINESQADMAIGTFSTAVDTNNSTQRPLRLTEKVYEGESIIDEIFLPLIGPNVDFAQDVQIESSSCFNLFRRSIIVSHQLKFPSERIAVGEDMFFNLRFVPFSKRIVVINESGYYYFENHLSTTRKYNPKRYERTINFYTSSYELVKEYGMEKKIAYRVDRTFLLKLRTAIRLVVVSDMTRKEKLEEIKRYLENETVVTVLANYPIDTFIPAMRFLYKLMRAKNTVGVYYLIKIREAAKGLKILKSLLKIMGIGK